MNNNKEFNANQVDGATALMMSLTKNNKAFAEIGTFIEKTLLKYKGSGNDMNYSEEETNVIEWLNKQDKGYSSISNGKRKFVIRQGRDRDIMNKIENQDYAFLKKIIDIMLKDITQSFLVSNDDIKIFSTSEYDDINAGIDAIVQFGPDSEKKYLGIDFCVTKNTNYISKKESKRSHTKPKEFAYYSGHQESIERVVKDFNPKVISLVFTFYLNKIKQGIDPSNGMKGVYEKAKEIVNQDSSETTTTVNSMKSLVNSLI